MKYKLNFLICSANVQLRTRLSLISYAETHSMNRSNSTIVYRQLTFVLSFLRLRSRLRTPAIASFTIIAIYESFTFVNTESAMLANDHKCSQCIL